MYIRAQSEVIHKMESGEAQPEVIHEMESGVIRAQCRVIQDGEQRCNSSTIRGESGHQHLVAGRVVAEPEERVPLSQRTQRGAQLCVRPVGPSVVVCVSALLLEMGTPPGTGATD